MKDLLIFLLVAFFVSVGVINADRGSRILMELLFGVGDAFEEVHEANKRQTAPPPPSGD